VLADSGGGIEATLQALDAQVYEQVGVVIVGDIEVGDATVAGRRVVTRASFAAVVSSLPPAVTHLWIVREGASPRPDALSALVTDMERTDAGIGGSKIVGRRDDSLVSVGLVTDAFCVPYTGMDAAERDQGQYDVIRHVAAVTGASMVVRRDLLVGLGGIDAEMTHREAAIDLAQRARLKGARTIVTPASVVDYRKEETGPRWKREASRIRSMFKVYGLLTLAWAIPVDLAIGLVQAFVSMFLGKWLFADFVKSWAWNIAKLPSTISSRRLARRGRVVGDPELFRFQRRGSVKVTELVQDVASALRHRLPGDDRLSVESIGNDVRQPAFVVGALAIIVVLLSSRNIWSDGFPAVGFTLPLPSNGWAAIAGYAGGWNPAGLGSPDSLRPLLAVGGIAKVITLNSPNLAAYLLTAGSMLAGIWGMTRLLRTWSIAAAPALIAGLVYVAGPTAQGISGNTHIGTIVALGVLPWALRLCLAPVSDGAWNAVIRTSGVVLVFGVLGAVSPLMLFVAAPALGIYAVFLLTDAHAWRALILALVGTAGGALLLSPWIWSADLIGITEEGYAFWHVPPVLAIAGGVVAIAAVGAGRREHGVVAGWGTFLAAAGFLGARSGDFGFGVETESVSLAIAGLGIAVVIGVVADSLLSPGIARARRFALAFGTVGVLLLVVASLTIVIGGRAGLPGDIYGEALGFTQAKEGEASRARVLVVGPSELMPGDSRTIQGGSYRVISADVPDLGEARLGSPLGFDDLLAEKLRAIIAGETRRAGGELAPFGIHWIVVMGDSSDRDADEASLAWRNVFAGQLDLLPLSSSTGNTTFVTDIEPVGRALTSELNSWERVSWSYSGEPEESMRVFVAENADEGWGPPPRVTVGEMNEVSARDGVVTYTPNSARRTQAWVVLLAVVTLISLGAVGRRLQ
jgi:hypothetical protein